MILKFNVKIFRADKWKVLHVMVKNNLYLNHSNCRKLHLCPPPTTPRLSHRGGQQIANRFRLLGKAGQVMCLLNSIILNHYSLLLCLILCNYGISQSCQLLLFTLLPNRKKCRKVYFSRNQFCVSKQKFTDRQKICQFLYFSSSQEKVIQECPAHKYQL